MSDMLTMVRALCLWLPEAVEQLSHGSPNFKVRGKSFASFVVNHHGDGRVALWLHAKPAQQAALVDADPEHLFVPPYVGSRGWIGARLDRGLSWRRAAELVRDAYAGVAPPPLVALIGDLPEVQGASRPPAPEELDPFETPRGQKILAMIRAICGEFPEVRETRQFGCPVWQAGKKTFAWARHDSGKLTLCFWVGVDAQGLMCADERFYVPAYLGARGWIALDVTRRADRREIAALALASYRHFALERMRRLLP
jgi:hypothetical protein